MTGETVLISAWGVDSVRVQASMGSPSALDHDAMVSTPVYCADFTSLWATTPQLSICRVAVVCLGSHPSPRFDLQALLDKPMVGPSDAKVTVVVSEDETSAVLVNGNVRVEFDAVIGNITISRTSTGEVLLKERVDPFDPQPDGHGEPPRWHRSRDTQTGLFNVRQTFEQPPCSIYGMGQRAHGKLAQQGMALDLRQYNTHVSIPYMVTSCGWGLLWNQPSEGTASLADPLRFDVAATLGIDYWFTTTPLSGSSNDMVPLLRNYADSTGHAPSFPLSLAGFWQSKLRYRTAREVEEGEVM